MRGGLIVGAMLNGIRRMDPVSERARRLVRDGENQRYALAAARGDVPSAARDGGALSRDIVARGRGRAIAGSRSRWTLRCRAASRLPTTGATTRRASSSAACSARELAALLDALPRRHREVLLLHYFDGDIVARGRPAPRDLAAARLAAAHERAREAQAASACCVALSSTSRTPPSRCRLARTARKRSSRSSPMPSSIRRCYRTTSRAGSRMPLPFRSALVNYREASAGGGARSLVLGSPHPRDRRRRAARRGRCQRLLPRRRNALAT